MKKLYVVRGIGTQRDQEAWVSEDFDVTMLIQTINGDGWRVDSQTGTTEVMCYTGFARSTGITLNPGEYTEIEVSQVL